MHILKVMALILWNQFKFWSTSKGNGYPNLPRQPCVMTLNEIKFVGITVHELKAPTSHSSSSKKLDTSSDSKLKGFKTPWLSHYFGVCSTWMLLHCTTQIPRLAIIHFDWLYQWSCAKKCESKCYERSMVWPHFPVMLCMHCPVKRISYEIAATTLPGYEEANLHEGKSISCLHHLVKIKVKIRSSN